MAGPTTLGYERVHCTSLYCNTKMLVQLQLGNLFYLFVFNFNQGKRFRYTPYDETKGSIHASIEALDRQVSGSGTWGWLKVHVMISLLLCAGDGVHQLSGCQQLQQVHR